MAIRPAKLITGYITEAVAVDNWTYDDSTGDPWIGYPYTWNLTIAVNAATHSSHLTPTPYVWTGTEVAVGDFIFSTGGARVLKIVQIVDNSDSSNIVVKVVDDDRENLFNDTQQLGDGGITPTDCYIFEVSDGLPVLYPMPSAINVPSHTVAEIISRFLGSKKTKAVEVIQAAHGFEPGDALQLLASGQYVKADTSRLETLVCGVVSAVYDTVTGPNKFTYFPVGPLVKQSMPTGSPGSLVYLSATGGTYTVVKPFENAFPIFIRIDANTGILLNQAEPSNQRTELVITAGEALSGHRIITNTGVYADKDTPAHLDIVAGMTLHAASAAASVRVRTMGEITESSWNWDATKPLFLGNAGNIVQTPPTTGILLRLGRVNSPTTIVLALQLPIIL